MSVCGGAPSHGTHQQVVSEVVSTFLLVFVTCGAAGIYGSDKDRISQLGQSVAGGLIVTVMIYAVGHISGAHMNPAVTLAFAVFRHFPWIQVRVLNCCYSCRLQPAADFVFLHQN